jgi:uncharacterized coiled-coil protein SlyX
MNDRITESEIRVARLEQTLVDLNGVTIAQGTVLEAPQKRLERACARLRALLTGAKGAHARPR